MDSAPELLVAQLAHHARALNFLAQGLTTEQAAVRLHADGPSAAWILDHLSEMTHSTLEALGGTAPAPLAGGAWPKPLAAFQRLHGELHRQASALPETDWNGPPAVPVLPAFREALRT
ncbi:MAG TPA: DinB family protein, partial [Planctomycetota bacterium]|nr:DinB family protein [Planctomycetota bacterium]